MQMNAVAAEYNEFKVNIFIHQSFLKGNFSDPDPEEEMEHLTLDVELPS